MNLPATLLAKLDSLNISVDPSADDTPWLATITVPGVSAFAIWKELAEISRNTEVWPVILGPGVSGNDRDKDSHLETLSFADAGTTLEEAYAATMSASLEIDVDKPEFDLMDDEVIQERLAEDDADWPEQVEQVTTPLAVSDVVTGKPHKSIIIGIFQARHSWETLARLQFGEWNDCPSVERQVARHRNWNERFGSDICAITHDTVECVVARPPQNREAAMALAREQYAYCYDIVEQGTQSMAVLAAGLLLGPIWFFWWD